MLKPSLDPRLMTAADFFPFCEYGADIGADHGHLSCYLLASGKCQHMQVSDLSATSLDKARRLLDLHELCSRATFCVGNGLEALVHPAQAIAICGMGGHTIAEILEQGKDRLQNAALILSPQTEYALVRKTIYHTLGYHIDREAAIWASNRFYVMMRAVPGESLLDERSAFLGPCLMKDTSQEYERFLQWRFAVVSREKNHPDTQQRLTWLKAELDRVLKTRE